MHHCLIIFRIIPLIAATFLLTACEHTSLSRTVQAAIPALQEDVDTLRLHPQRQYLRVSVGSRKALMVLGYRENDHDVWYSAQGETLYLQEGRVIATAGFETDWRAVRFPPLPSWKQMIQQGTHHYRRERDEMPGYRFGIIEHIALRAIAPPTDSKLVKRNAHDLHWFEERMTEHPDASPARFAIRKDTLRVIYGEHCLSPSLCLAWQEWPVTP